MSVGPGADWEADGAELLGLEGVTLGDGGLGLGPPNEEGRGLGDEVLCNGENFWEDGVEFTAIEAAGSHRILVLFVTGDGCGGWDEDRNASLLSLTLLPKLSPSTRFGIVSFFTLARGLKASEFKPGEAPLEVD